jgi:hypothetical protein
MFSGNVCNDVTLDQGVTDPQYSVPGNEVLSDRIKKDAGARADLLAFLETRYQAWSHIRMDRPGQVKSVEASRVGAIVVLV